jgi:pyoverdine/dityrosine biosynthesis protein Dit1
MRSNLLEDANALKPEIHPHCNSKAKYTVHFGMENIKFNTVVLFSHTHKHIYIR